MSFSTDSQYISSSSADEKIRVWNVELASLIKTINDNNRRIWVVAFNTKSEQIVSAGEDSRIKLWSMEGDLIGTLGERLDYASIYNSTLYTFEQLEQEESHILSLSHFLGRI